MNCSIKSRSRDVSAEENLPDRPLPELPRPARIFAWKKTQTCDVPDSIGEGRVIEMPWRGPARSLWPSTKRSEFRAFEGFHVPGFGRSPLGAASFLILSLVLGHERIKCGKDRMDVIEHGNFEFRRDLKVGVGVRHQNRNKPILGNARGGRSMGTVHDP